MNPAGQLIVSTLLCHHLSPSATVVLEQVLHEVAEKHNVSVANVALKWVMQQ